MQNPYQPINCDFHELLLAKATLKSKCLIFYYKDNVEMRTTSIIIDVFTKKGEEFMVLQTGETIRLDHIISVDQETQPPYTCTF